MKVFKRVGDLWILFVFAVIAIGLFDIWVLADADDTFLGCRPVELGFGCSGPFKSVGEIILNLPFLPIIPFVGLAFVVTIVASIVRVIIWLTTRRGSPAP